MSTHEDKKGPSDKASNISNTSDTFNPPVENDSDFYSDSNSEVNQSILDEEENKNLSIKRDSQSEQNGFNSLHSPYAFASMASVSFSSVRPSSKPLVASSNVAPDKTQLARVASGQQGLISQIPQKPISEMTSDELALTSYVPSQLSQVKNEGLSQKTGKSISVQSESSKLPPADGEPETFETGQEPQEAGRVWIRRHTSTAVNRYANLKNTPGFVGAVAIAFAAIPAPKSLMAAGDYFFENDGERFYTKSKGRSEPRPTAAANVKFKREHTMRQIFKRRLKAFCFLVKEYVKLFGKYVMTLKGFAVTLYFLLVIAFGGMLFLLLCNAAPAMSREWGPNDKEHSPRQIWIEIDSQILNALFCITGLGLFPIRMRDLYLWIRGRYLGDEKYNTRILKIHSKWFWSGFTSDWKLLMVILLYIFNSIFQVLMCFVMWNYNRFTRPPWTTGTLIAASFGCTIGAGIIMFFEAKRIDRYSFQTGKARIQGVPFDKSDFHSVADDDIRKELSEVQMTEPVSNVATSESVIFSKSSPLLIKNTQEKSKGLDNSDLV